VFVDAQGTYIISFTNTIFDLPMKSVGLVLSATGVLAFFVVNLRYDLLAPGEDMGGRRAPAGPCTNSS
jgi:hypothetical protein